MTSVKTFKSFPLIPCVSPLWAPEKHSQTILGDKLPSPSLKDPGDRWLLVLPDGDQIVCRVHTKDSPWVVFMMHGLTGSAEAGYTQRTARDLLAHGLSVVLMNHRNCGEGKGLAKHPYHCGRSDDVGFLTARIRERFPGKKVLAIGFSLSASALLLLMSRVIPAMKVLTVESFAIVAAEMGLDLPDVAITINAPINLQKTCLSISRNLNRIYEYSFMSNLHTLIKDLEKSGTLSPAEGLHRLMKTSYFDHHFTAPRAGFDSAMHYYETCSAMNYVDRIDRPTACLTSTNDPFIDCQDYKDAKFSKHVRLQIEESGGHMGYWHREKTPMGSFRWLDYGVFEIAKEMMKSV